MRGLNAANMSREELIQWLEGWLDVSEANNEDNFSLYLHMPVLLAMNKPSNLELVETG